jgi:predicted dehydrogenase
MAAPRIGVIGTGWWATQFHLPGLMAYDGVDVVALADPDTSKLAAAAEHFGVERSYEDPQELIGSGDLDGVMIVVPHAYHYDLARAALDARLHVFVEKPMVLTASHAWDLVRRAAEADLHLTVGYTYQHTRAAAKVREVITAGGIGELIHVAGLFASMVQSYYQGQPEDYRSVFDFPMTGPGAATYSDPKISGGGQAMTQITHAMGMVLWATDRRVDEVAAYMSNRGLDVDLVDAISYRMDNGAIGTMAATGSLAPGQPQQQEFRYYGTEGFVLQDLLGGTVEVHRNDGTSEVLDPLGEDEIYPAHLPGQRFADLIAGSGENLAPAEAAARVVEFLEAAYRSAELRRPVGTNELS